ncbi:MAG: energy transducer TonB [Planctomycetota bacterium]
MKLFPVLGVVCAVLLHLGFLLFGGILFAHEKPTGSTREVELLSELEQEEEKKADEKEPEAEEPSESEELTQEEEPPPDAEEIIRSLELSPLQSAPALEAASLSAIEAALGGNLGAGGDFSQGMDFTSGGRIGGSGKAALEEQGIDQAFSLAEIDQKPRAIFQASPNYPADLRGKKLEGVVTLTFTVDADGKVGEPRVEKSTHPSFDKPALEALKKWKFEPALRGGKRVACRMRVPIRFKPS